MIVKDSMVLIHLAKLTILETSCDYFRNVSIPKMVHQEVTGSGELHPDTVVISNMINKGKIKVRSVKDKKLIEKANQFNIQKGEAECVALYWQENAKFLATDDDNVRKKSVILDIPIIGTPSIMLKLYKEKQIGREKFEESISELRKIGWFSNAVLDKISAE